MSKIGCDPEFAAFERLAGRSMISSEVWVKCPKLGKRGLKPNMKSWGEEIGTDCRAFEFRPEGEEDPRILVENLKNLFLTWNINSGGKYGVKAGSYVPYVGGLGGHLHFDFDRTSDIGKVNEEDNSKITNIVRRLDLFLQLPLLLVDDFSMVARRLVEGYGTLTSWRSQPWGFEYRSPQSWLLSYDWALRVLTLGKLLTDQIDTINFDLVTWENLYSLWRGVRGDQNEQFRVKQKMLEIFKSKVLPTWRNLILRNKGLGSLLGPWIKMVDHQEIWDVEKDSLLGWGIPDPLDEDGRILVDRNVPLEVKELTLKTLEVVRPLADKKSIHIHNSTILPRRNRIKNSLPFSLVGWKDLTHFPKTLELLIKDVNSLPNLNLNQNPDKKGVTLYV